MLKFKVGSDLRYQTFCSRFKEEMCGSFRSIWSGVTKLLASHQILPEMSWYISLELKLYSQSMCMHTNIKLTPSKSITSSWHPIKPSHGIRIRILSKHSTLRCLAGLVQGLLAEQKEGGLWQAWGETRRSGGRWRISSMYLWSCWSWLLMVMVMMMVLVTSLSVEIRRSDGWWTYLSLVSSKSLISQVSSWWECAKNYKQHNEVGAAVYLLYFKVSSPINYEYCNNITL